MKKQLFVVEPIKEDGTLDAKRVGSEPITEGTENQIFDYFFSQNKEKSSASWTEVMDFFKNKSFRIRKKYW